MSVVTAATWSGSVAWRSPSRAATTRTSNSVVPSDMCAMVWSSPNICGLPRSLSPWTALIRGVPDPVHPRPPVVARRHREPDQHDHDGAHGGQRADDPALEAHASECALRGHGDERDAADDDGEAEAERHDQRQAEADAVQRDRREQHDERGRAREDPARHAHCDQAAEPSARVRWRGRGRGDGRACRDRGDGRGRGRARARVRRAHACAQARARDAHSADADDEQCRGEVQPRVELLGDDEGDRASVTSPSAKTPIVCVKVTVSPSSTACQAVPRVPTM